MVKLTFTMTGGSAWVKLDSFNENLTTGILSGQFAAEVSANMETLISGNFKDNTSFSNVTAQDLTNNKTITINGSYNRIADFVSFYNSASRKYGLSITLDHT